jgi:hypothetical protein
MSHDQTLPSVTVVFLPHDKSDDLNASTPDRIFNQIINKEEKYEMMERLTNRDKDDKLTVRIAARGRPVS